MSKAGPPCHPNTHTLSVYHVLLITSISISEQSRPIHNRTAPSAIHQLPCPVVLNLSAQMIQSLAAVRQFAIHLLCAFPSCQSFFSTFQDTRGQAHGSSPQGSEARHISQLDFNLEAPAPSTALQPAFLDSKCLSGGPLSPSISATSSHCHLDACQSGNLSLPAAKHVLPHQETSLARPLSVPCVRGRTSCPAGAWKQAH